MPHDIGMSDLERVAQAMESHWVSRWRREDGTYWWVIYRGKSNHAPVMPVGDPFAVEENARSKCRMLNAVAAVTELRQPSEAMLKAANELPVTKKVDGIVSLAFAHGISLGLECAPPNTPIQQWYRAMIDAILTEQD